MLTKQKEKDTYFTTRELINLISEHGVENLIFEIPTELRDTLEFKQLKRKERPNKNKQFKHKVFYNIPMQINEHTGRFGTKVKDEYKLFLEPINKKFTPIFGVHQFYVMDLASFIEKGFIVVTTK